MRDDVYTYMRMYVSVTIRNVVLTCAHSWAGCIEMCICIDLVQGSLRMHIPSNCIE